jgi:hypothetical protein
MIALSACAGCHGGLHRQGEHQMAVTGSFGTPIEGDVIWPDGDGRADNAGVTLGYGYYVRDRLAVIAAGTPYRNYNQSDGDVYTGEFQLGVRYHFVNFCIGDVPVGLYAEAIGGIMAGSASVPEEGSHANFTQDTGVGIEVQLMDGVQWMTGYRLRHLSNGYIFGSENPSQNDHHIYTGIAITLK